jgi:hypothetical protein
MSDQIGSFSGDAAGTAGRAPRQAEPLRLRSIGVTLGLIGSLVLLWATVQVA